LAAIEIVANGGLSPTQQHLIRELVQQRLADLPTLVKELATGTVPVF
jgi:S-adenosylmethionine synthetase